MRLRELAQEARESAAHDSMSDHRRTFLKIAEHWEQIAGELEAAISDGRVG